MKLYQNAGSENTPPDTGLGMGAALYENDLAARTAYAAPTVPGRTALGGMNAAAVMTRDNLANDYNIGGEALPVKYDVPSHYKDHFQAKEEIAGALAAAGAPGSLVRNVPVTEDEIQYLQSMKKQAELADFDRYVHTLIDPRKPGNLKWLMEIYPEYVNRRIQQVHTDYEFALRNQMIDSWGINTFDDLHFKYQVDQGKVNGPRLGRHANISDAYAPGLLSPWTFKHSAAGPTLKLPFASATFGKRPRNGAAEWTLSDENQPFAEEAGRTPARMAASMYKRQSANPPTDTAPNAVGRSAY